MPNQYRHRQSNTSRARRFRRTFARANLGRRMLRMGAINKVYTYRVRNSVPAGNITPLSTTYGNVFQPFGGTAVPTIIRGVYGAGAPGTEASFAMYFTLADIPQTSIYVALYDQYKISRIKVTLAPLGETGDGVYSTSTQSAQQTDKTLWYTVDLDDASPLSRSAMQEYQTTKMKYVNPFSQAKPFSISWVPHVATGAYTGSVFSGFQNTKAPWIDCSSTSVQHYGLKCLFSSPLSTAEAAVQFNVLAEYSLVFRNVK